PRSPEDRIPLPTSADRMPCKVIALPCRTACYSARRNRYAPYAQAPVHSNGKQRLVHEPRCAAPATVRLPPCQPDTGLLRHLIPPGAAIGIPFQRRIQALGRFSIPACGDARQTGPHHVCFLPAPPRGRLLSLP